jgi:hypothetical protein
VNRIRSLILGFVCLALVSAGVATTAQAQGAYVSTDRFGYSGSIMRYTSMADALAHTNAVAGSPFTVPGRDLGLFMNDGNAAYSGATYANSAIFLSAWYYPTYPGNTSSPSNQNTGFIQHYDVDGGSVTSMNGQWLDAARTTYGFSVTGGNGQPNCTTGDCGRLWNAGSSLGSSETTAGVFYSYALSFTASGLASATWDAATGVFKSVSEPTSVFGSLTAVFQNTSTTDPSSNGWYTVDLALDMNSWAYENGDPFMASEFGSNTVPEPMSVVLMASGLLGIAGVRRVRRKNRA